MGFKKSRLLKFLTVSCFAAFLVFSAKAADAATLYFSPSSGNFSVGDILNVGVMVNTQSKAINNADAVINFPSSLLEVVSVSKSGSIFSLWVEEPAFSNSAGTITFNGGLPTPGFNGSAGKMVNIVFRARAPGTASVVFPAGAVRANDGYGTDILQARAQAQFNLISEERPVVPPPSAIGTPQAPDVSSPTHPDPDKWYSKSTAILTWPISADVNAARLSIGKIPTAAPIVLYVPPVSEKTIADLEDGTWYFHAQLKNNAGWGGTTHFRLQIDTENPERFDIQLAPRDDATDPRVKFIFEASDKTSGIDHYEVQIDGKDAVIWRDDGSKTFVAPILDPRKHILVAKAVDKAGNYLTNSIEFNIGALDVPIITDYPKEVTQGEILMVLGTTYPDSEVTIWLQKDEKAPSAYNVRSDSTGKFVFISDEGLELGVYKLWAKVTDRRGASSDESNKVKFVVKQPTFIRIGTFAIGFLSLLIPILALIILLILMLWYSWHKFMLMRKRLKKEVHEAETALHRAFDLIKEDIHDQVKMLEKVKTKRELTKEEEEVIKRLKHDLDDAEKYVIKEIEDIEREIK